MNIGIIYGSKSTEHEISIISMLQVKEFIKDNVYLLYLDKDKNLYLANGTCLEDYKDLKNLNKKFKEVSFIKKGIRLNKKNIYLDSLIILNHGKNGEDGMSAALASFYDIPYVGTNPISSGILLDKTYTNDILCKNNYKVAKSITYTYNDYMNGVCLDIIPCIIKPSTLGSSIGINIVNSKEELEEALIDSFKYDHKLIIQELLTDFIECNISCYTYNNEVIISNIEQIIKDDDFLSFKDKYEIDDKLKNHHINPDLDLNIINKVKQIANDVYLLFECSGIIRIDLMIKDNDVYVNEINTTPGALANYLYDDFFLVIKHVIKQSITDFNKKNRLISSYDTNILNLKSMKK